jgi:competence protein ComEC
MMRRLFGVGCALTIAALSCSGGDGHKSTTPPPTGKTLDEYLEIDAGPDPDMPPDTDVADAMKIHMIDVGQGAATLVEFPCGAILIDTGGELNEQFDGQRALTTYLDSFFERRQDLMETINLLVITHPHIDHNRSIENVLKNYVVENVIDNSSTAGDFGIEGQLYLHEWVARMGKNVNYVGIKQVDIDGINGMNNPIVDPIGTCDAGPTDPLIRVMWGLETVDADSYGTNPNDHSVVIRVDYGKSSALFTGDLQVPGIARMHKKFEDNPRMLDVDVYQVGHHGSKNATVEHQMRALSPKIALIPVGPYERRGEEFSAHAFGHPHQNCVNLLTDSNFGVSMDREPVNVNLGVRGAWKEKKSEFTPVTMTKAVYATGWDGDVVVSANSNGWLDVTTHR